jgi:hypothetical protein
MVETISGFRQILSQRDASSPLQPVARKSFTRSEVHCKANNRSVHDQVSKSGWVRGAKCRPTGISSQEQNVAEFFAELRAEKTQFVLFAPPYSFEIIGFPGFAIPLLTDRL